MKVIVLVFVGLLLLNFGSVFAEEIDFVLIAYARNNGRNYKFFEKAVERQIEPITKTFGLDLDPKRFLLLDELGHPIDGENTSRNIDAMLPELNMLNLVFDMKLPLSIMNNLNYSLYRNGQELNNLNESLTVGDTIRFYIPKNNPTESENDWIVQGASTDSPPIEQLTLEEYEELKTNLLEKHREKYPLNYFSHITYDLNPENIPSLSIGYTPENPGYADNEIADKIPKFETEKIPFNDNINSYLADNGYTAYIVPSLGKKLGLQVFCSTTIYTNSEASCRSEENYVECRLTKINENNKIEVSTRNHCMIYVDKVIIKGQAIQADWLAIREPNKSQYVYSQYEKTRQMEIPIYSAGESPIPNFRCEIQKVQIVGRRAKKEDTLVCNASKSFDPDGEIIEYSWNPDYKFRYEMEENKPWIAPVYYINRAETITLTVKDNDGIYSKLIRTIPVGGDPEIPPFNLYAAHNSSTGMTEITTECEGIVELDIENAVDGTTEIEKAEIPCGETTEIGPFNKKGAFRVIGSNNEQTKEAIFTVN